LRRAATYPRCALDPAEERARPHAVARHASGQRPWGGTAGGGVPRRLVLRDVRRHHGRGGRVERRRTVPAAFTGSDVRDGGRGAGGGRLRRRAEHRFTTYPFARGRLQRRSDVGGRDRKSGVEGKRVEPGGG